MFEKSWIEWRNNKSKIKKVLKFQNSKCQTICFIKATPLDWLRKASPFPKFGTSLLSCSPIAYLCKLPLLKSLKFSY